MENLPGLDWLLVALLGVLAGAGDVISRFHDEPRRALFTGPGVLYLLVNAGAAMFALLLTRVLGWGPVPAGMPAPGTGPAYWQQVLPQVLAAGFGAIVILRSSITVQTGDQPVKIGFAKFIETALSSIASALDRKRAQDRDTVIREQMMNVAKQNKRYVFAEAYKALPPYALGLMQNLSAEEQKQFAARNKLIFDADMDESVKVRLLFLSVINAMGEKVLKAAVRSLDGEITQGQADSTSASAGPVVGQSSTPREPVTSPLMPPVAK